ncbi:hypothetical protein AAMO2058_000458300 [Amorphochlora amoebiformis]
MRRTCLGRRPKREMEKGKAPEKPPVKGYPLRDGMGLVLKVDSRCETRRDRFKDGELWLVELMDRKRKSIRLRHLTQHAHLGLTDRCAMFVPSGDVQKTSGGAWVHKGKKETIAPCVEFVPIEEPQSWLDRLPLAHHLQNAKDERRLEFISQSNEALGFEMFVDATMSTRGVSGRIAFYRRNYSQQRIPLPFPQTPSPEQQTKTEAKKAVTEPKPKAGTQEDESDGTQSKGNEETNGSQESEGAEPSVATEAVMLSMFRDFDRDNDNKLNEAEMLLFAREVCNFPRDWAFDNWWKYILYEYGKAKAGKDGSLDTNAKLDFNGFREFILNRPNKDDICKFYISYRSSQMEYITGIAESSIDSKYNNLTQEGSDSIPRAEMQTAPIVYNLTNTREEEKAMEDDKCREVISDYAPVKSKPKAKEETKGFSEGPEAKAERGGGGGEENTLSEKLISEGEATSEILNNSGRENTHKGGEGKEDSEIEVGEYEEEI